MYTLNATGKVLYMSRTDHPQVLAALASHEVRPEFIHVEHDFDGNEALNLIEVSRLDLNAKELLVGLANFGYYVYMSTEGTSRLVQHDHLGLLWKPVSDGTYQIDQNGLVYSFTPPLLASQASKLLVVFSSVHEKMYTPSLMRYFTQNFSSIQKYLAPETAVLRIADVGGVVGNFYLNTKLQPNNVTNIQALISATLNRSGVSSENVVLYGGSKGATGALYHGLVGKYGVVAVEPIVDDLHYHDKYADLHYTKNTFFDIAKEVEFESAITRYKQQVMPGDKTKIVVIYSSRSPQKPFIERHVIESMSGLIKVYDSDHPNIKDHPHVAKNTIPITLASINCILYHEYPDVGFRSIV